MVFSVEENTGWSMQKHLPILCLNSCLIKTPNIKTLNFILQTSKKKFFRGKVENAFVRKCCFPPLR